MKELNEMELMLVSGGEKADFSDVTSTFESTEEIVERNPMWHRMLPGMFR